MYLKTIRATSLRGSRNDSLSRYRVPQLQGNNDLGRTNTRKGLLKAILRQVERLLLYALSLLLFRYLGRLALLLLALELLLALLSFLLFLTLNGFVLFASLLCQLFGVLLPPCCFSLELNLRLELRKS